jgi:hypothetical protein
MLLEGDGYGGAEGGLKGVEYWKQLSMFTFRLYTRKIAGRHSFGR